MKKAIFLITILVAAITGCATNQDVIYLDNRIDNIQNKLSQETSALKEASKDQISREDLKKENARLIIKYQRTEESLRRLEGKLEEFEHALRQQEKLNSTLTTGQERTETRIATLASQVKRLESYTGYEAGEPSGEASSQEKPAPQAPAQEEPDKPAPVTDVSLYAGAKHAFDLNSMEEAKAGFLRLLKEFPKSENADNAQFWLGEIYYRDKWYQKAILEYQKVIENYPTGNKVAAAYLKQGISFLKLGEKENGHLILNELVKKFPDSPEARTARNKIGQGK